MSYEKLSYLAITKDASVDYRTGTLDVSIALYWLVKGMHGNDRID